jgi:hypothetical protein
MRVPDFTGAHPGYKLAAKLRQPYDNLRWKFFA